MLFNSYAFLVFLPCFLALYWSLRGNARIVLCLAGSYLFYGWWDYRFLGLLVLSTGIDYAVGCGLGRREASASLRRLLLGISLVSNLGILATFKYFNFFVDSFQQMVAPLGWSLDWPTLNLILPAGISFYTFQTLSYSIDVYRKQIPPQRDLLRFATFVCFFPQLVAGPIVRAREFFPQLETDRRFSWQQFESGFGRILQGFFKKLVIADSIGVVADPLFHDPGGYSSLNTAVVVVLYAFQVYGDFSGYSDIAIGTARMLGIELPENFRTPYLATSPANFWHRWHISLSTWLRDYVYIPLGGSRNGDWKTYRNLAITMLLGGLWHGASWNFVIWGAIHATILIAHRIWISWWGPAEERLLDAALMSPDWLRRLAIDAFKSASLFAVVCVTWVFFRSGSFDQAIQILTQIASLDGLSPSTLQNRIPLLKACALVSILMGFEVISQRIRWPQVFYRIPVLRGLYYASLLWSLALWGTFDGKQFIYFQF
ncbi:Peptidoglycan O-acetyltransferase [Rosistilla carotiformis]|uniref:Peptidoglycan O-acetyltransferase n=1 Tax=Rosistilla carotiformis TaxID=2528017 RepID=A0A518JTE3_9BACT|nr:MBOAT family O-acyltransferase [Rosistilla carotiformis]QDV68813.1 Peptidoglycan O-acetyltransferase [Rosistilla carotiformis]